MVDGSGGVVGMVVADEDETGLKAMPGPAPWTGPPQAPDEGRCGRPMGPRIPTVITGDAPTGRRATLQRYFAGINTGDYDAVFDAFEPGVLQGVAQRRSRRVPLHVRLQHHASRPGRARTCGYGSTRSSPQGRGPRSVADLRPLVAGVRLHDSDGGTRISRVENRTGVPLFRRC